MSKSNRIYDRRAQEKVGQKFGRLMILEVSKTAIDDKDRHRYFARCLCDCGIEKWIALSNITSGRATSCGCIRKEIWEKNLQIVLEERIREVATRGPHMSSARNVFGNKYKDGDITFEQFLELTSKDCFYCGMPPSNCYNVHKNRKTATQFFIDNGDFIYNGLDRVDNNKSHNLDNIVPCCIDCNKAKMERTQKEFFEWIDKVYKLHCEEK